MADLENEINAVDEELANAHEDYNNGKISEDKYYNISQNTMRMTVSVKH